MANSWRVAYKIERAVTLQAMFAGGRYHFRGWAYLMLLFQTLVTGFFAPLGALLLAGITGQLLGLLDIRNLPPVAMPLTVIFFVLFFLWLSHATFRRMAQATVDAKFNAHTVAEIGADGFTQVAPNSTWRTGWADIEAVVKTKQSICVYASGIVLFVPLDAFASPAEADAAFNAMQGWVRDAA